MTALRSVAVDIGPEREMTATLEMPTRSIDLRVRYFVSYPSVWHRGHGIDRDITIVSVTYEDGADLKHWRLLPGQHDAICERIEADEMGLD